MPFERKRRSQRVSAALVRSSKEALEEEEGLEVSKPRKALKMLSFHCPCRWIDAMRTASRLGRLARRNDAPIGVPKEGELEPSLSLINAALFFFSSSKLTKKRPYPASLTLVTVPQFWKIDLTVNSSTLDSTFPT